MSWKNLFPEIKDPELLGLIDHHGTIKEYPKGTSLMKPGQNADMIPLVLDGVLKISREDEEGKELLMYYLHEGDTCAATLNCCINRSSLKISAVSETDVKLLFFPARMLNIWMDEYPCWRDFIMSTFQKRFDELLATVDSLAFQNMDERLWNYLQEKTIALDSQSIPMTHQQIADEIHSSREVVSRLLKQLEKKGFIELGRNVIEVV